MKRNKTWLISLCTLTLWQGITACSSDVERTSIAWDKWGVPHIRANNVSELFFSQGWSQMHLHGNLVLELYGRSRGKGAEYWGKEWRDNDVLIHTLDFPSIAKQWRESQDPELKKIIKAFVDGMNAYAQSNPNTISEQNRVVLPIEYDDVNLHYLFTVYTRFVGGGELDMARQWSDRGSNTCAIGPSRSASKNAMLVQNPHLPWFGEFTFTESHFISPSVNLYGATLVGFPGILIGFNEHLGWSHTNNTIDNSDLFELRKSGSGYVLDERVKEFQKDTRTILVRKEDGTKESYSFEVYRSEHGPIVGQTDSSAVALRMPGYDRPNGLLQWWHMGLAQDFKKFEDALKMAQIPFWNVMYADGSGNIFYLFNGIIPKRSEQSWAYWSGVISGGHKRDIWSEFHPYNELPFVKNPPTGWLQNSNDPPWSCTRPQVLYADSFPDYFSSRDVSLRSQRAVAMFSADSSITFDELIDYKLSTRMEMADRLLDDLFAAIDKYGTATSRRAKAVLEKWDRQADSSSIGTLLFASWAQEIQVWDQQVYRVPWSESSPFNTPDGLADPKAAVTALDKVSIDMIKTHGSLEVPWGKVWRIRRGSSHLAGNGASSMFGVYRVTWPGGQENNVSYIGGGDSWVGVIEFGDKVKAKVLLSYGNATQDRTPHNGDQLKLFSEKKFRDAFFYEDALSKETIQTQELVNGKFTVLR